VIPFTQRTILSGNNTKGLSLRENNIKGYSFISYTTLTILTLGGILSRYGSEKMSLCRIETMWRMGLYTGVDDVGVLENHSNDSHVFTKNGGRLRQETT
jgi:hypothetical protein